MESEIITRKEYDVLLARIDSLADLIEGSRKPLHRLSAREAADYLGVSLRTVDALCAERKLRPARIGRKRSFGHRELDAFLRASL